jgi:hypothetical protein
MSETMHELALAVLTVLRLAESEVKPISGGAQLPAICGPNADKTGIKRLTGR